MCSSFRTIFERKNADDQPMSEHRTDAQYRETHRHMETEWSAVVRVACCFASLLYWLDVALNSLDISLFSLPVSVLWSVTELLLLSVTLLFLFHCHSRKPHLSCIYRFLWFDAFLYCSHYEAFDGWYSQILAIFLVYLCNRYWLKLLCLHIVPHTFNASLFPSITVFGLFFCIFNHRCSYINCCRDAVIPADGQRPRG